jgi:NAD(P)-dependent dehydrogenase (short-subunit alcohol dehydrogenase family)
VKEKAVPEQGADSRWPVAIVTGAGQGIGQGIALRLAAEGWRVAAADIDEAAAQSTTQAVRATGGQALALPLDVRDAGSIAAALRAVLDTWGSVAALINNAGVLQESMAITETPLDEWQRVLAVNLTGVFLCCQAVAPVMMAAEHGRIVNIASLNALSPAPLVAAYNVSKAGVVSLTKTLAYELAPFGVTVNAICPGPIDTATNRRALVRRAGMLGITLDELLERVRANIPAGRMGMPEDIAQLVAFLISDGAGFLTAETFTAAGGMAGGAKVVPRAAVRLAAARA